MEDILKEILAELKEHSTILKEHSTILKEQSTILKEHSTILKEHSTELNNIKKSVQTLEIDMAEVKDTINKYVFTDIAKLEKRLEILEKKVG
jgi:formate dehydrogenase maturation protein FdhE